MTLSKVFGKNRAETDMTNGSIIKHLLVFAVPLLIGNLFQQLYNAVDTLVIGQFGSNEAFSAVGTVGPITNLFIGFFTGLASGAGAIISQLYGADRKEDVKRAVHTSMIFTLILGVILTFVGLITLPYLLEITKTRADVRAEQTEYLRIYFYGLLGLVIYNMGSGILRAIGDSTRPFIFLVISALINIALDLLFVVKFDMGVGGVAVATVIAQAISALLVLISLFRSKTCIRMSLREAVFDTGLMLKIIKVGIPAALQVSITSFSNIFVQSYISYFDNDCMSGWTAYSKIDMLAILPMQAIALASTTFVGQNIGKGQRKRAEKGMAIAMIIGIASVVITVIPIMIFAPWFVSIFNSKPEVVAYGTLLLRWISPFYVLCAVNQICTAALRGSGNSIVPMIIMLFSFVAFRQIYLYYMANYICNEIIPIAMGYPAGWLLCSILSMAYYFKFGLGNGRKKQVI